MPTHWKTLAPTRTADRKSTRPPVLVVNTYAGSLLLAAESLGLDVLGSYEDVGYGTAVQAANFPHLEGLLAGSLATWPRDPDLSEAVVIAHPPCAAFSVQNNGATKGADLAHFACTLRVMRYAFEGRARALLVESVPGALEGGAALRDALAAEYKYGVYHVLQNAATFGLPQWRPRYWAVFLRDPIDDMVFAHTPVVAPCGPFFAAVPPGEHDARLVEWMGWQRKLLRKRGVKPRDVDRLLMAPGRLPHKVARLEGIEPSAAARSHCVDATCPPIASSRSPGWTKGSPFMSHTVYELDKDGPSPSILWDSWWTIDAVPITPAQYKAAGGFPTTYALDKDYRKWLSKGVAPPVAAWILDNVLCTLERDGTVPDGDRVEIIGPGQVADFRVNKAEWARLRDGGDRGRMPTLPPHARPLTSRRQA